MGTLLRWLLGTVVVTFRYLRMTTPLHRDECQGWSDDDLPPEIPGELLDDRLLLAASGVGPMFHRRFRVHIAGAEIGPQELLGAVVAEFHRFVPQEVVGIRRDDDGRLCVGQEFVVEMPGPWDGPVRVVQVDEGCLRLATMHGHLETGQVRFRSYAEGDALVFEVEAWARCATRLVHLLYAHLRLAKEIQLNMWVRFCLSAAAIAGGRPRDGVHVSTRWVAASEIPVERTPDPNAHDRVGARMPISGPERFPFRFTKSYRLAGLLFGVAPSTAEVILTQEEIHVRFGPWRLRTARANVASGEETGGFAWSKTAGPAHLSLADRGITFATNGDHAACLQFHEPVPAIAPTGRIRHSAMTVTVTDPAGLIDALR